MQIPKKILLKSYLERALNANPIAFRKATTFAIADNFKHLAKIWFNHRDGAITKHGPNPLPLQKFFGSLWLYRETTSTMDEKTTQISIEAAALPAGRDLKAAIQKARLEDAERSNIAADLMTAEVSRLEILHDQLLHVFAQLPKDADMFNHGLVPGERPRLYIDMVAFIEMSRDRRTYRFLLDTRSGRQLLGENDDVAVMTEAITNYLGRRIVERDKALASTLKFENASSERSIEYAHEKVQLPVAVRSRTSHGSGGSVIVTFILGLMIGAVGMILYLMLQTHGDLPLPNPLEWLKKVSRI